MTKEIKKALIATPSIETEPADSDYLSSGLTLLNLATYGHIDKGFVKGKIYRIAGRSGAGKTFLGRTILAEATVNPNFDGYELIYDDIEYGALMDTEKFFGQRLVDRLVPPARTKDKKPIYSRYISDFYTRLMKRLDAGKKVIWITDSMDSLDVKIEEGKKENKMTDGKAKTNSQNLRKLLDPIAATGSILILVSQAHVDMKSMFGGDLAAGGRALEFYSTTDIWLRKVKTLMTVYKGGKYPTGVIVSATVKKNRLSGKDRVIYFPFHESYGIDDIGSCVDFLTRTKHWPKEKSLISPTELEIGDIGRAQLIQQIEAEGREQEVRQIVGKVWNEIEKAITVERKHRYD